MHRRKQRLRDAGGAAVFSRGWSLAISERATSQRRNDFSACDFERGLMAPQAPLDCGDAAGRHRLTG